MLTALAKDEAETDGEGLDDALALADGVADGDGLVEVGATVGDADASLVALVGDAVLAVELTEGVALGLTGAARAGAVAKNEATTPAAVTLARVLVMVFI